MRTRRLVIVLALLAGVSLAAQSARPMWLATGPGRTAVVLLDVGDGWYALRVSDGGLVTGELMRFSPATRESRVGTTAPAGWRLGGR